MPTRTPSQSAIVNWDLETTLAYGREGLERHAGEQKELLNRRNVLLSSSFSDLNIVLREVVMLSLAAEDFATVEKVIGWLEEAGDPAMGYYAYVKMKEMDREAEVSKHLLSAAAAGHILAQKTVMLNKASRFPFYLRLIVMLPSRIWLLLKSIVIAFRNPKDLRLR